MGLICAVFVSSVSNIDYDLDLQFLKSEEELAQEKRAKEAKEAQARAAKEPKNEPPPSTGQPNRTVPAPSIDRSVKPNSLNNVNNKNLTDNSSNTSKVRIETINNNLNKPGRTTNLEDLRKSLEQEMIVTDKNNINAAKEREASAAKPVPDRALKPKTSSPLITPTSSNSHIQPKQQNTERKNDNDVALVSAKMKDLDIQISEKEKEAEAKQKENQRLALEHKVKCIRYFLSRITVMDSHLQHCFSLCIMICRQDCLN